MLNEQALRQIFEQPYNRTEWYKVLRQNLNISTLREPAADITSRIGNNTYKAKAFELGQYETPAGQLIGLYEVQSKGAHLARNRKALRDLLGDVYRTDVDAALLVFVQDDKWRFSYVSEITIRDASGKRVRKATDPKRYTYLFGAGEKALTAARQFSRIRQEENLFGKGITLELLQEAFNVEKMSKDFFNEYRRHYGKFTAYLTGEDENSKEVGQASPLLKSTFGGTSEACKKEARDFIKKLLGRIVFLYFLEKKGWLGVPLGEPWGKGDENFLSNLFRNSNSGDAFYPTELAPLFFEALNTKRTNDLFKLANGTKVQIPFLNGGLFEADEANTQLITFPEQLFAGLFEFFDRFNFTVYEDSPDEHTVAVDPEMLGHIFENLLEDNKGKGAYYTPKEIVHYMCQESLIEYLYTKLNPAEASSPSTGGGRGEALVGRDALEKLIKQAEVGDVLDLEEAILTALYTVKVCDPAIGSGAFPMGVLLEIFHVVETLFEASPAVTKKVWKLKGDDWISNRAAVKQSIIQNSIYGVDIEQGAVDIARLRFWLSLVVDEEVPQPLPNLDYKIVVGNSLLSKFGDVVIDIDWNPKSVTDEKAKKLIAEQQVKLHLLQQKQHLFFVTQHGNKQNLKTEIRNLKIDILINQLEITLNQYKKANPFVNALYLTAKEQLRNQQIQEQTAVYADTLAELKVLRKSKDEILDYFDWKLNFPEVVNEKVAKEPGFDIVVGNPPYVQLQKMGTETDLLADAGFNTFARTSDIYCLFYEMGNQLLKTGGNLVFITSNSWLRANYGKQLRNYLRTAANPLMLIDLSDSDIFQSATVRTNILQFSKSNNQSKLKALRLTRKSAEHLPVIASYFNQNHSLITALTDNAWVIADVGKATIQQKVETSGKKLKHWDIEIYRGVLTGFNEAFVIDADTRKQLIKEDKKSAQLIAPLLRGRDLRRYGFEFEDLYLICTFPSLNLNINDYPAIKKHLLLFGKARLDQSGAKGARKKTSNEWFETQDQISYWQNFEQPKIIYPNMVTDMGFAYDEEGYYTNQKCFILIGEKLKYLTGVLNSKLFRFCYEDTFPEVQGNAREINKVIFVEAFVKYPSPEEEDKISKLVDKVLKSKEQGKESLKWEQQLDVLVYHLYHLTYAEACLIEGSTEWITEEEYNAFSLPQNESVIT